MLNSREVVRQFHVATLKRPLHRRPFAYRIFQGPPQQFAAAREVRLPEHLQTLLYPPHYVSRVPGLRRSASLYAAGWGIVIPAPARVALGLTTEVPAAPAFRRQQGRVALFHKLRDLLLEGLGDTGHGLVDESLPVRPERLHLVLVETLQVLPALVRYAQALLQRPDSPVQGVYLVAQLGDCGVRRLELDFRVHIFLKGTHFLWKLQGDLQLILLIFRLLSRANQCILSARCRLRRPLSAERGPTS